MMMVWKICVPKINVGVCGKDLILGCYHLGLGPLNEIGLKCKSNMPSC